MLWRTGCRWLGRDPVSGSALDQPAVAGVPASAVQKLTASPRRYGFHATLKAPFTLVAGSDREQLFARLAAFAAGRKPIDLPKFEVHRLGGFLALCLSRPCTQLDALAAQCVERFDTFRKPLTAAERARRAEGLDPNQLALLDRWGYPYAMAQWRFHMTLTDATEDQTADVLGDFLNGYFRAALGESIRVNDLCLYVEPEPGAEF
ncbi:MAG: DUF1045 domain-containing protein, partial [Burkholderiales bacterium]